MGLRRVPPWAFGVAVVIGMTIGGWMALRTNAGTGASSDASPPLRSRDVVRAYSSFALAADIGNDPITASALGPAGLLAVGTASGAVYLTSTEPLAPSARQFFIEVPGKVIDLDVSGDGSTVAALSAEGILVVATISGDEMRAAHLDSLATTSVALNKDGSLVGVAGFGLAVFDVATGAAVMDAEQPMLAGGRGDYQHLVLTDDEMVVAITVEGVDTWRIGGKRPTGPTAVCDCAASGLALSGNGRLAGFGTADGRLVVINSRSAELVAETTVAVNDSVSGVAMTQDGSVAIATAEGGAALVLDTSPDRVVWQGDLGDVHPTRMEVDEAERTLLIESYEQVGDGTGPIPFGARPWLATFSAPLQGNRANG